MREVIVKVSFRTDGQYVGIRYLAEYCRKLLMREVCMYVCMYVCMDVCMDVGIHVL